MGLLLTLYAAVSLYPFLWMVSAAFKDQYEVVAGGHLIPHHPTLHTLTQTWNELRFFDYFLNSLKVTGLTVVLVLVVYSMAGYAFAVLRFPGRRALYRLFLALLFVPAATVLLPIVLLENELGILGTHWGLVLPFVNGSAPLSILLLTNAFETVPVELREAALVDGGSEAAHLHPDLPAADPARAGHHRAADRDTDLERVPADPGVAERPAHVHAADRVCRTSSPARCCTTTC